MIDCFADCHILWGVKCINLLINKIYNKFPKFHEFPKFQNIHVCTVYTNLGDDAVVHALNETEVSVVVTSHELLPRFKEMLVNLPNIKTIIYMEDQLVKTSTVGFKEDVDIVGFRNVVTNVSFFFGVQTWGPQSGLSYIESPDWGFHIFIINQWFTSNEILQFLM